VVAVSFHADLVGLLYPLICASPGSLRPYLPTLDHSFPQPVDRFTTGS
jgi:hypothetical protein